MSNEPPGDLLPDTPCTRVCTLDPQTQRCVGCHRSLEEIANWSRMSRFERHHIMAALAARGPPPTDPAG